MKRRIKAGIVQSTHRVAGLMAVLMTHSVQMKSASVWMQMVLRYQEPMSCCPMEGLTALHHEQVGINFETVLLVFAALLKLKCDESVIV